MSCALDCPYLEEAHRRERYRGLDAEQAPNRDVELSERFLQERQALATFAGFSLLDAALSTSGAVDSDVREALESLIRTYRTRESGLYYETRPTNLIAGAIHQRVQQGFEQYRERQRARTGVNTVRDADILGVLVFWQRLALVRNNGRRLGRPFLASLRDSLAQAGLSLGPGGWETRGASPLIVP